MKKLHAVGFDMIDCDLTGPLYLTGNTEQMFAQGNFLIDAAKIRSPSASPTRSPPSPSPTSTAHPTSSTTLGA